MGFVCTCTHKENKALFSIDEVSPWCIIGFDSLNRTPEQRIDMLKQMGFTKYGFEKGKGDLSFMKDEFKLAKENNIEIISIFLRLNTKRDSIGKLSPMNQELLSNLAEIDNKPTIWLSFSNNFFEDLNQEQSIELSIKMIDFIKSKADEVGCKLALYNHRGWFGNPFNQVEILEKLNHDSISIVYNFHHAHEYIDEFPAIVKKIKPYLSHVNLNGVKKEGPEILPIGQGDSEFEMINQLLQQGYNGPWGILGHLKNEDVQIVLNRNIDGLNLMNSKLKEPKAK
ncbi:sugar phosphate isomerase/epimerase [Carboxylicivirga sp. M1479]|uniref:sugar phosphate isomerase/epimerase family protein n=2 Tax=Carboxylicivirga TaxID=1628153 RepID=UPI00163D79A2|nr:TIM barrel protein [Carboxylicivirga sp. M1479]